MRRLPFLNSLVVIAALGYFVDIYDLLLFGILRVPSLQSFGLTSQAVLEKGIFILNMQMGGMLIGGILWGILGDKKGRLSVLFGSIILYSVASIANGFVSSVEAYAFWRFIAGVGLAGELGAGITLVSETLSKEHRGYGTMITASFGILGAVAAGFMAEHFAWRTNYIIGGGLGLGLLILRISTYESGMYLRVQAKKIHRGRFVSLFNDRNRFFRYLNCILIGLPMWFVIGIVVTFSPEFGKELGINTAILAGKSIVWTYAGLVIGDVASGLLSQMLRSRKKSVLVFLMGCVASVWWVLHLPSISTQAFYGVCFVLGISCGYWAVFMTVAAEQFGTNLRSTVATTVPNFVRGSVIPATLLFQFLRPEYGIYWAALGVGAVCFFLAFVALFFLEETFGKELDFVEIC